MMRPKAKVRDSHPSGPGPQQRRGRAFGPTNPRRPLESRFAPLGPTRAPDNDDHADTNLRHPPAAGPLPPANLTLLIRAAGLVVVVAAVLLTLRPVAKIVRTATPATDPARIRVISSAGDHPSANRTADAAPARGKRQGRLPQTAATLAPTAPVAAAAAAESTPAALPPAAHAMAFAPEPAAPTNPGLVATVRAVPVLAPDKAAVRDSSPLAPAVAPALPQPRPEALAAATPPAPAATTGSTRSNAAMVRDARRLIAKGRLADGRALLERAAAAGDSHAATILAKTYDPATLKVWHVKGATVDPAEARRWYEKAQALGSPEAKAALAGMH